MTVTTSVDGGATAGDGPRPPTPWYRRRAVLVALGVVAVVVVTVLSDLPVGSSRSSDVGSSRTVMTEVNYDLAGCSQALREAFADHRGLDDHTLSAADLAELPSLLRDDQQACSFTNESIYDLSSNIEVPGSASGRHLGAMVAIATTWVTSDALGAIIDIEALRADPGDQAARRDLATRERDLAKDRHDAETDMAAADRILGTTLPAPDLAASPLP